MEPKKYKLITTPADPPTENLMVTLRLRRDAEVVVYVNDVAILGLVPGGAINRWYTAAEALPGVFKYTKAGQIATQTEWMEEYTK